MSALLHTRFLALADLALTLPGLHHPGATMLAAVICQSSACSPPNIKALMGPEEHLSHQWLPSAQVSPRNAGILSQMQQGHLIRVLVGGGGDCLM